MKLPLSWIKESIDINVSPEEISRLLTLAGLEVDGCEEVDGDAVFEISLTPNLGHCMYLLGVVRELSAATNTPFRQPQIVVRESSDEPIGKHVKVRNMNPKGCPRYACRLVKGVKVEPSPAWLKARLEKCGLRSVNNIVDITNYVLMEMGHPLHAFDFGKLSGHEVIIKDAIEGTTFKALDGKERILKSHHLTICDAAGPVAIAGVMGGLNSEVSDETRDVLLEAAYFDPVSVRKTSKQLDLQTDSSKRFERGTDPNVLVIALNRAAMLIQELAGGQVVPGVIDIKEGEFAEKVIPCRLSRIQQVLGIAISLGEVENIFQRLGFRVVSEGQNVTTVSVPTFRSDITTEIDLVEEVARLYGYDNIAREGTRYLTSQLPHSPMYLFEKEIHERLLGEGLQEFLTCDLIGPSMLNVVKDDSLTPEATIKVLNPTSIEQSILRTSLLPGLLQVVKTNIDYQNHDISGFEIGRIHFKDGDKYEEPSVVGIVLSGKSSPHHWDIKPHDTDFFDLKGIAENLLKGLGIENPQFKNTGMEMFHTGRQADVIVNGLKIGSIGEVHPAILRRLDVTQRIFFGEFNLRDLMQVAKSKEKIKPIPLYPCSERDWTLTLKESVSISEVLADIRAIPSKLLEQLSLVDIYRSDKLGKDKKNVTLHFVYRDLTKTVSQEEVDAEHKHVTTAALKKLGDAVIPTVPA